jgi:hypothetical protein
LCNAVRLVSAELCTHKIINSPSKIYIMETSTKIRQASKSRNNIISEKRQGSRFLKLILLVFVLVSITLLSSCFVGAPPRMGHVRSVEINTPNDDGNRGHHGGEHHDNGRHRGHRD